MTGNEGLPDPQIERRRDPEGVHQASWSRTLETMHRLADERRDDGWEVVTVMAAHTDTVSRDMGDHDRFGLTHIIPNNHAGAFRDTYDPDRFTEYQAYGTDVQGFRYVVLELLDLDGTRSILIACRYDMTFADGMINNARDEGVLYSHVKTIDGTILGTFAHEPYESLVAPADRTTDEPAMHLFPPDAWNETNEDMRAIAADRRADGWDVVSIAADRTVPVSGKPNEDRAGLVHTIPDPSVEAFEQFYERGSFPEYLAYRNEIDGTVYLVTECIDPERELVILIAGRYVAEKATNVAEIATERGRIHTYVEDAASTPLGEFTHEDPWPLLPIPAENSASE